MFKTMELTKRSIEDETSPKRRRLFDESIYYINVIIPDKGKDFHSNNIFRINYGEGLQYLGYNRLMIFSSMVIPDFSKVKNMFVHRCSTLKQSDQFYKNVNSYKNKYDVVLLLTESIHKTETSSIIPYLKYIVSQCPNISIDVMSVDRLMKTQDIDKINEATIHNLKFLENGEDLTFQNDLHKIINLAAESRIVNHRLAVRSLANHTFRKTMNIKTVRTISHKRSRISNKVLKTKKTVQSNLFFGNTDSTKSTYLDIVKKLIINFKRNSIIPKELVKGCFNLLLCNTEETAKEEIQRMSSNRKLNSLIKKYFNNVSPRNSRRSSVSSLCDIMDQL